MKASPFKFASVCLILLSAATLVAQSTHTWVSATGKDTNSGTMASPYADFATAVANTAAGGTVSVLGPGDYGSITLTQSITIDGTGGGSINFAGDSYGIFINAGAAANIVLRNLSIDGGGTGVDAVYVFSTGTTNVVNVVIDGCLMSGFTTLGVGVGSESPMYVTVRNTTIQGGELGVRTFQSSGLTVINDHVQLDHVTIQGVTGGGASAAGVFTRNGNLDISNSTIAGSSIGIQADTNATLNVQSSMITSNSNGVCVYSGSTAIIGTSTVVADNTTNIEYCGGTVQGMSGGAPPLKP